jgi:O-acetyl-ADP-ribose deacetylase (regulator of RNase III)
MGEHMIQEVTGDILLSSADSIAHGVAPNDDFKHGLALSLREQWPAMYKDFRHYCHTQHPKSGDLWVWQGVGGTKIVNLMTQEAAYDQGAKPGKASLEYVNTTLKHLRQEIETQGWSSLALPRLATGVGG